MSENIKKNSPTKAERDEARRKALASMKDQKEMMTAITSALDEREAKKELIAQDDTEEHNTKCRNAERKLTHKPVTAIIQPKHVAAARRKAFNTVMNNMDRAAEVLAGKRKWNNQQVSLFGKLVNKVIPDLHHSVADVTHNVNVDINNVSVEDLMRIALDDANVIEGTAAPVEDTMLAAPEVEYTLADYENDPDLIMPEHLIPKPEPKPPREPAAPKPQPIPKATYVNVDFEDPLEDLDFD